MRTVNLFKFVTVFIIMTFFGCSAFSQNNAYQITSTTGGFVAPVMTTVNRTGITTPTEGSIVYDNTVHGYYYYDNVGWKQFNNATFFTGILPIANGGTNIGTLGAAGSVEYSNGTQIASTAVGTSGQVLTSNGAGAPTFAAMGTLVAIRVLTTASVSPYTATAGTSRIWVRCVGGGGGGAGAGSGSFAGAAGGGAGGYCEAFLTYSSTIAFSVGAAGAAGVAASGTGGTGGVTTFGTLTANGGVGGPGQSGAIYGVGGAGGTASGGDINIQGTQGQGGEYQSGGGGNSFLGGAGPGYGYYGANATGVSAVANTGSGGGGATSNGTSRAGGAGAAGTIIIYEFK